MVKMSSDGQHDTSSVINTNSSVSQNSFTKLNVFLSCITILPDLLTGGE